LVADQRQKTPLGNRAHEIDVSSLASPTTDTMIRAEEVDPRRKGISAR